MICHVAVVAGLTALNHERTYRRRWVIQVNSRAGVIVFGCFRELWYRLLSRFARELVHPEQFNLSDNDAFALSDGGALDNNKMVKCNLHLRKIT